jgi:formyltetrahydrofolate hydrolase
VSSRLVITCPDRPGIISAVSTFLAAAGANIVRSDQYSSDPVGGTFFLRMEFTGGTAGLAERFGAEVGGRFDMEWRLSEASQRKRVAILVSREDHCLQELLWRQRRDELDAELVLVASNHAALRADVEAFGLTFHHVPVTPETKPAAEAELLELLSGSCDVVVLARRRSSTPARSSSRTSSASRIATMSPRSQGSARASSARCSHAPSAGTARTASCVTATRPWSSRSRPLRRTRPCPAP